MTRRLIPADQSFLDGNGDPLSGGLLNFYETNTSTRKNTYSDNGLTTANDNPIVLNSSGKLDVDVWGDGEFKLIVTNSSGGSSKTYDPLIGYDLTGRVAYANIATMAAVLKDTLTDGNIVEVDGYTTAGDGGGGQFKWDSTDTSSAVQGVIVASDEGGLGRWTRIHAGELPATAFGFKTDGTNNDTPMSAYLSSAVNSCVFEGGKTYNFAATVTLVDDKNIVCNDKERAIFDFTGVFASSNLLITCGSSINRVSLKGIKVVGGLTSFNSDGADKYAVYLPGATNSVIDNCEADGCEAGLFFRDGSSDCFLTNSVATNCYLRGLGAMGTSGNPCQRITITGNKVDTTETTYAAAPIDGIRTEEVYDSNINNNTGTNVYIGLRIENSCDNVVTGNRGFECWKSGIGIYNNTQRNFIAGNHVFDNNRANQDNTDLTSSKGNANTNFSGINVENNSGNNVITGNFCYQTPATIVPFTSGSEEPNLGCRLTGATSGATGRIRKIVLNSGSWGGGDAEGELHLVDVNGTFNSSEALENSTTYIPYNSGSETPDYGDTISGASSGATGVVLWFSVTSGDASNSDAEGILYLTGVSGTFNGSENLDNDTQSQSNFATNNAAITAENTDFATSNGASTAGSSKGFQKYGIGVNVRNLTAMTVGDTYNIISNNQCFNNDLNQIEDRGFYNTVSDNNEFKSNIIRNA